MPAIHSSIATFVAIVVALSLPVRGNADEGVDLAKLQRWAIVVADDAIESERYAARDPNIL